MGKGGGEFTLLAGLLLHQFPCTKWFYSSKNFFFVEKCLGIVCSLILDFLNIIYLFLKKYLDFSGKIVHI